MGRPMGVGNHANERPHKDKITISFDRFQLLRSIAYTVKQEYDHDHDRLHDLLKELDVIEARDWTGLIVSDDFGKGMDSVVDRRVVDNERCTFCSQT